MIYDLETGGISVDKIGFYDLVDNLIECEKNRASNPDLYTAVECHLLLQRWRRLINDKIPQLETNSCVSLKFDPKEDNGFAMHQRIVQGFSILKLIGRQPTKILVNKKTFDLWKNTSDVSSQINGLSEVEIPDKPDHKYQGLTLGKYWGRVVIEHDYHILAFWGYYAHLLGEKSDAEINVLADDIGKIANPPSVPIFRENQ